MRQATMGGSCWAAEGGDGQGGAWEGGDGQQKKMQGGVREQGEGRRWNERLYIEALKLCRIHKFWSQGNLYFCLESDRNSTA